MLNPNVIQSHFKLLYKYYDPFFLQKIFAPIRFQRKQPDIYRPWNYEHIN